MCRMSPDKDNVRKVAYAIYFESKENGLENDSVGDWLKAERICRSWLHWLWWQILWHVKRYPGSIAVFISCLSLLLNLLLTSWVVLTNNRSTNLANRPYVSVNVKDPVRRDTDKDTYYGNDILLKNTGKTPASRVSTSYYITTDIDKTNRSGEKWFDEHMGGFGSVSFITSGAEEVSPG